MRNIVSFIILSLVFSQVNHAQNISMYWPEFAGKTYDFIIFQGDKALKVQQDTIPKNGKFELKIPTENTPYIGMSRWLITNTTEGGGIDMSIPGYGFEVSCLTTIPNETNIAYKGYDAVNELNKLSKTQSKIIEKHSTMVKAMNLYEKNHKLFKSFDKERQEQEKVFAKFQEDLASNPNHGARFLPIVNIVNGIAPKLYSKEEDKFKEIARFFAYDLDIDAFYTSGHWSGIIGSWAQIHMHVIKDEQVLFEQFNVLTNRIKNKEYYTDLTGKLTYYMKSYGMDKEIDVVAPIVVNSGKITEYIGTMEVYIKALTGAKAPNLVITEHLGNIADHNHKTTIIKSEDLAQNGLQIMLILFYESGCGPCEALLQQLPGNYDILLKKGIDIVAISSDLDEQVFKNTSKNFPWQRTFCDFEGKKGPNFKNFAVLGTPTMYLIDKTGKIETKLATIQDVLALIQ